MEKEATIRRGVSNERSRKPSGYWLIVGREDPSRTLVLYSGLRGEILPAFGSEEDASVFLTLLRATGDGFRVRYMAVEGLASLLSGPLASVERVALDPTPEMDEDAMLELISVGRENFVRPRRTKEPPRWRAAENAAARCNGRNASTRSCPCCLRLWESPRPLRP